MKFKLHTHEFRLCIKKNMFKTNYASDLEYDLCVERKLETK
jgi:hypothetical protein